MPIELFFYSCCSITFDISCDYFTFTLTSMAWRLFLSIVLLLFIINVNCRSSFRRHQTREFWRNLKDKFTENTINKFGFDNRHFDREETILFPDVAFQTLGNDALWKVVIHGWRYVGKKEREFFGFTTSRWVERIAKHLLNQDAILYLNGSINRERLKPFFVEDEFNDVVSIKIGDKISSLRTDQFGQIYGEIDVTNAEIQKLKKQQSDDFLTYTATGDIQDTANGVIRLIEPRQGVSIISDIDDTIKISEVLDKVRLLANTFIHPFKAVPGKYKE